MSHFYGTMQGSRGEATRCGTKNSGMSVCAASWKGAIRTDLFVDGDGDDAYRVVQTAWRGEGVHRVLAEGKIGQ